MNLLPSEDQIGIAEVAHQFLAAEIPLSRVREMHALPGAVGHDLWSKCADLGWLGLAVPEEAGGIGLGLPEEAMLARELGRALTPGPFVATALSAFVAAAAGDVDLAGNLMSGAVQAGLAISADCALDAATGGLVACIGRERTELRPVVGIQPLQCLDPGVRVQAVDLGNAVVTLDDSFILGRLLVALSAQLLGIIEAVRDMSASYARSREQFGRPIGVHQAVKHRCADMSVGAYAVQAQVNAAAVMVEARHPDGPFHAAAAHRLAVSRAKRATADNIQNLGGIGFTWEHDAHLFLKRVEVLDHAAGPRQDTLDLLMAPPRYEFR
ncbi:acyl-CoA dehydrogenase family protein [Nocardia sp. NPDC004711]